MNVPFLEGSVLDYLSTDFLDQKAFRGGFLRLVSAGAGKLQLVIEIDSPPRTLTKALKRPE